jgi:BirA family biotin operon repressor/biotin-[acetyl-CoA-carboxylase] ligase
LFKIKNKLLPASKSIGQSFVELQTVDSTNNYATALLHEGMAHHGTVVFAHRQTAGRGQRNKTWHTGNGENLAFSIIVKPFGLPVSQLFLLSMATAVGLHHFFSRYAGAPTKLKWPNDLYWGDRKTGGILIENTISGEEWKHAIVGIGTNINQVDFEGLSQNAVSLKQITGVDYDVVTMAKELCGNIQGAYEILQRDPQLIITTYQQHLYKLNEVVRLKKGARVFEATAKGVTRSGQLIVQHTVEELFSVGEVEWIV